MRALVVMIVLVMMAGCAQMQEYAAKAREQQRQADLRQCSDFGYQYGTEPHADCMYELYQDRLEDQRRRQDYYEQRELLETLKEKECKTYKRVTGNGDAREVIEEVVCR